MKFRIYEAVKTALKGCAYFTELVEQLNREGVTATFIHRGGDPAKGIQGITFTKENLTFKASQVDRKFSYANLCKIIEQNKIEKERQKAATERQKQAHSTQTPIIFGVRLTDEQVEQIKDGQPVYIKGMQYQGKTFNGSQSDARTGLHWTRPARVGRVRQIHHASHGQGPDKGRFCRSCPRSMVGRTRANRKALPLERESLGRNVSRKLGRSKKNPNAPTRYKTRKDRAIPQEI